MIKRYITRRFITGNTMMGNKSKSFTNISIFFLRSRSIKMIAKHLPLFSIIVFDIKLLSMLLQVTAGKALIKSHIVNDGHQQVKLHIIWQFLQCNTNKIWSSKASVVGFRFCRNQYHKLNNLRKVQMFNK